MTAAVFVPGKATGPVEAHVPGGLDRDMPVGSLVSVELAERIRNVVRAPDASELRKLIAGDIQVVRRLQEKKGRTEDPIE